MYKNKFLCAALMAGLIGFGWGNEIEAASPVQHDVKVIPYPAGVDAETAKSTAALAAINHNSSPYFSHPDVFNLTSNNNLTVLHHYPTYQQTKEYTSGPAAGLTVLYWYGNRDFDELSVAKDMGAQPYPVGTDINKMTDFFRRLGWQVESSLNSPKFADEKEFKSFVVGYLNKGVPIMVKSAAMDGYWRVIIGYDTMGTENLLDDVLIMVDPYDTCDHLQDGYTTVSAVSFYHNWFNRNGLPENERENAWVVTYPGEKKLSSKKPGTLFVTDLPGMIPATLE